MHDNIITDIYNISSSIYDTFSKFWVFCSYDFATLKTTLIEMGFNDPVADGGAFGGAFIMDVFITPLANLAPNASLISFIVTLSILSILALGIWNFLSELIVPV